MDPGSGDVSPGSTSRRIDVGGPVAVREYPGPPGAPVLLCLHGLGGSGLNFTLVGPLLAAGHRVVVPDLAGHGTTPARPVRPDALADQLDRVAGVARQVAGDAPVHLLGHSMGGVLAALIAARRLVPLSRLILLDPPVPSRAAGRRDRRMTAKRLLLRSPGVAGLVARQVTRLTAEELAHRQLRDATPFADRVAPEAVAASVEELRVTRASLATRQRAQFAAILATMALLARADDWRRQLASITVPTLWLQGAADPLAPADDAAALAATRPDWTFLVREGVGHLPHLEDPAWTAAAITSWTGAAVSA